MGILEGVRYRGVIYTHYHDLPLFRVQATGGLASRFT